MPEICAESDGEEEHPAKFDSFRDLQRYLLRVPLDKLATETLVRKHTMLDLQRTTKEQIEAASSIFESRNNELNEYIKDKNELMMIQIQQLQEEMKISAQQLGAMKRMEEQVQTDAMEIERLCQ